MFSPTSKGPDKSEGFRGQGCVAPIQTGHFDVPARFRKIIKFEALESEDIITSVGTLKTCSRTLSTIPEQDLCKRFL